MATSITSAQQTALSQLYVAFFNRAADSTGLGYWANNLLDGASIENIAQSFYNTDAARPYYSQGQTNAQFIETFYSTVLGRAADAEGKAYWVAQLGQDGQTQGSVAVAIVNAVTAYAGTDAAALTSKALFNAKVEVSTAYALTGGNTADATGVLNGVVDAETASAVIANLGTSTQSPVLTTLTTGADSLGGTVGDDVFTARIIDNANTLQSGDKIAGDAGNDRLEADIGTSQAFAITPETTGVETVAIRAQAISKDSTDNNTSSTSEVQIDAQRMKGVTTWESNNSRADLVIEDVRIEDNQITSAVTIAMVETDPGHVDFGVYFDQYSLRAQSNSSSTLTIELLDTRSAAAGTDALLDNPYWGFTFKLDGVTQTVTSTAIDAAQTYAELLVAVQAAIATTPALANFTASLGATFSRVDTLSGASVQGTELLLNNSGAGALTIDETTGWQTQNGTVPNSSGLHTFMTTASDSSTDLVTSKIILDDVGRGSTGGDLVVGGLSVGDTSLSKGVEKFEIEVRDNSKLQTINSTNNTLEEVVIRNGATTSDVITNAYDKVVTTKDSGNLTVNGTVDAASGINTALPGSSDQHNAFGFSDVRVLDASAMTGKFEFTAEITEASVAKYMNLTDTASATAAADTINFAYTGGANSDTMKVSIDGAVLASNTVSGREDFSLNIDGGAGDDVIALTIANNTEAWYNNQDLNNNVEINGGAGDDTITTVGAGDVVINGGAGNDTVYTDNTGAKAQWVFNTTDVASARDITNLRSDISNSYNLFNTTLTVTFKGVPNTVTIDNLGYKTTDLQINQAIKAAIKNDAVLSKLLLAEDGPANTLVITSVIDGAMSTSDLSLSFTAPPVDSLSAAEISAAGLVYNLTSPTEASVLAAINASLVTLGNNGDYVTAFANDNFVDLTGSDSISTSDNIVTPGAGNDVIVLGTTEGLTSAESSNETLVFGAGFGNDVIVNFAADGFGIDHLDFTAIGGTTFASLATDKSITISTGVVAAADNTIEKITELYAADNTLAQTHVYVAVNAHNVGTVYQVVDGAGVADGNVTATVAGTIDLAGTDWFTLGASNFVDASAAGYSLIEGPTGATGAVVPPAAGFTTVDLGTTAVTATAAAEAFVYDFEMVAGRATKAGDGEVSITGFDVTNDKLVFNDVGTGTVLTEAEFMALAGVVISENPFDNNTSIYFDAVAGVLGGVTLVGVVDAALNTITVETTA